MKVGSGLVDCTFHHVPRTSLIFDLTRRFRWTKFWRTAAQKCAPSASRFPSSFVSTTNNLDVRFCSTQRKAPPTRRACFARRAAGEEEGVAAVVVAASRRRRVCWQWRRQGGGGLGSGCGEEEEGLAAAVVTGRRRRRRRRAFWCWRWQGG